MANIKAKITKQLIDKNINDLGSDKLINELREFLKHYADYVCKVGIMGNAEEASIGAVHEYGVNHPVTFNYKGRTITIKNGIPARSFIRMPIETHTKEIEGNKKNNKDVLAVDINFWRDGKEATELLHRMGARAVGIIQEAFDTQGFREWKPNMNSEYVEAKGSDTPLIDTGRLRESITYRVDKR